eukprot:6912276-Heterocapsa_arctica.AAC.1
MGRYEQIIMWSKIHCSKLEIYIYGIDKHVIDGDNFSSDKECIRLLYCNKGKWGVQPNHYDLMHPIENTVKKVKKFVMKYIMEMNQQQIECEGDY